MKDLLGDKVSRVLIKKVQESGPDFDGLDGFEVNINAAATREAREGFNMRISGADAAESEPEERCADSLDLPWNSLSKKSSIELTCSSSRSSILEIDSAYLGRAGTTSCQEEKGRKLFTSDMLDRDPIRALEQAEQYCEMGQDPEAASEWWHSMLTRNLLAASAATAKLSGSPGIQQLEKAVDSALAMQLGDVQGSQQQTTLQHTQKAINEFLSSKGSNCVLDITRELNDLCKGASSCKIADLAENIPKLDAWRKKCLPGNWNASNAEQLVVNYKCQRTQVVSALNAERNHEGKFAVKNFKDVKLPAVQTNALKASKILEFIHDDPKFLFIHTGKSNVLHGVMFNFLVTNSGTYSLKSRAAFFGTSSKLGQLNLQVHAGNQC
eukprot:gnl/MRDRNA2_/MRDRNA2_15120_c0_seq2.p1 gnl/MRDRNA2_/MRDRNA2_15120_c0~~gnl/MRDRNA2_/MRDRNA2_15120_c0_seq2.p1  ORF type:complete len:433 (+),score=89.97 gnl/MRDRNA2_/MRDRNA2_15120_c0_seq2:155-1300(+)